MSNLDPTDATEIRPRYRPAVVPVPTPRPPDPANRGVAPSPFSAPETYLQYPQRPFRQPLQATALHPVNVRHRRKVSHRAREPWWHNPVRMYLLGLATTPVGLFLFFLLMRLISA